MPSSDPWLARQNAALKLKGHGVTLDVAGSRVRLRATMPPRPTDPPGSVSKQQRISTGLVYPDQSSEALQLAEKLGNALERHRVGTEAFDWSPWLPRGRKDGLAIRQADDQSVSISGRRAVRLTYQWWQKQRTRGASAEETWKVGYQDPLTPLLEIDELTPDHLVALVETTKTPSRSRTRVAQATANVAKALAWSDALVLRLRAMGKGYSPYKSQVPRHLPTDEQIEQLIDSLSATWQWPVAVVATYGCRPHEALLFAEIQDNKLLHVSDGKTGSRQAMALPDKWIQRWSLQNKRLPPFNREQSNRAVGALMGQALRRAGCEFKAYDLRHAWAIRAIHHPQLSASFAAKSMGHDLAVHTQVYQRYFDGHHMEAIQALISSAA